METMRIARSMFAFATEWMPQAACSSGRPSGAPISRAIASAAASHRSSMAPPLKKPGFR
jgi:hypothetical protein